MTVAFVYLTKPVYLHCLVPLRIWDLDTAVQNLRDLDNAVLPNLSANSPQIILRPLNFCVIAIFYRDPETRAHTLWNLWKNLKQKFKRMLGVHGTQLESHIEEFLWRNMFGKTAKEAFDNVLLHISEWYAV